VKFDDVAIPINAAWSSPFVRWQGSLAEVNSIDLAVGVTASALDRAGVVPSELDSVVVGITVPQQSSFYGAPTIAARLGAEDVSGPMISQACATGVACLGSAAATAQGEGSTVAVITTDRISNGPVLTYPSAKNPGGAPVIENWVLDSFARDPWGGTAMVETAESVAAEEGIERHELDEVTALRGDQYQSALADGRAFQKRWMVPVVLPSRRGDTVIDADEGVRASSLEELSGLRPVGPDGVITYGSQTHPADGTAGMVVTTVEQATRLAGDGGVAKVLAVGGARTDKARMPKAPVPAAGRALEAAGLGFDDVHAVVTHNPFAVNDVYFTRQTGIDIEAMNARGCSLIYGHPQAPTGTRGIVELIHGLVERGGGIGLFTGCAAGDTGAAVVISVEA
jgi:acetyl-CoA C-acetyltransferase